MRRFRAIITAPDYFDDEARGLIRGYADLRVGKFERSELIEAVSDVDALFIKVDTTVDKELIDAASRLKVIASGTTGINHIDAEYARKRGIRIFSLHGQHTRPTAEHAFGLIFVLLRSTPSAHASMLRGEWERGKYIGRHLEGRTLGIIGLGRIGRKVSRFACGMGMHVLAYDPYVSDGVFERLRVVRVRELKGLMSSSEIITIHAELTPETKGMIGRREIGWMMKGSYLINTARGQIVDPKALVDALTKGRLSGAAVDVYAREPPPRDDPLIEYARSHENLMLTPHIAGSSYEAIHDVGEYLALKVKKLLTEGGAR
jgi:D-3-phosphoglycerate dehydrogenase